MLTPIPEVERLRNLQQHQLDHLPSYEFRSFHSTRLPPPISTKRKTKNKPTRYPTTLPGSTNKHHCTSIQNSHHTLRPTRLPTTSDLLPHHQHPRTNHVLLQKKIQIQQHTRTLLQSVSENTHTQTHTHAGHNLHNNLLRSRMYRNVQNYHTHKHHTCPSTHARPQLQNNLLRSRLTGIFVVYVWRLIVLIFLAERGLVLCCTTEFKFNFSLDVIAIATVNE